METYTMELLKELCSVIAPSGSEVLLHHIIRRELSPYTDDIKSDTLGNLIVHIEGKGPKVMFAAHTDTIGLIVTHVMENGMANFDTIGDFDAYTALHQHVQFTNGATGIVSLEEKDATMCKDLKTSDLMIDFGTNSCEETEKLINNSRTACFVGELSYNSDCVCSAALDNRVGCYVLIEAIKKFSASKNDLYFVFTAERELGSWGAKIAANTINPDYAIVVDTTAAGDVPSKTKTAVSLGLGPIIKVMDESFMGHPYVNELISSVCGENGISYQYEASQGGYNDAGCIYHNKSGVPSGCICIPTRYSHSPCGMIDLSDIENCIRLMILLIERGF